MQSDAAGRRALVAATVLALAVDLPLIASNTIFGGDDWAWVWTYHAHGVARIFHLLLDASHPGFAPVIVLTFWLGGEVPGRAAHAIAVLSHLGSTWILWRIFDVSRDYAWFAAAIAIAYSVGPFLGDLSASLVHDLYDVFVLAYLCSIWQSGRPGTLAFAAAIITCVIGLSIETLAVLELVRWWHLYHRGYRGKTLVLRGLPYVGLIIILFLSRVTWLVPKGIFAGYNAIEYPGLRGLFHLFVNNLSFFTDIRQPLDLAVDLFRYDSVFVLGALLLGIAALVLTLPRHTDRLSRGQIGTLAFLGIAVLFAGMAPYIAIGREATRIDTQSRLAVASQFGALILIALIISLLRPLALRVAAIAAFVLLFAANQLQLDKWLIYEGQVVGDVRRQIAAYLAGKPPEVLLIDFDPPAKSFLYLQRACLSSYDTNVGLEIAGQRNGSFVYDRACGAAVYHDPAGCLITGYDPGGPCPADKRTATFAIDPTIADFTKLRLIDVLRGAVGGPALATGTFTPTASPPQR
jgi:hypothetical protein